MGFDKVFANGVSVAAGGRRSPLSIGVVDGKIAAVEASLDQVEAGELIDCGGNLLLPGLIDAHNHPYYDEDMAAFSESAAYGGLTTLLSFAGSITSTVNPAATAANHQKPVAAVDIAGEFIDFASDRSRLDFSAHVILSGPDIDDGNTIARVAAMGVRSFKVFMAFPGSRMVDDGQILSAMQQIAAVGGLCMVHCENGPAIARLEQMLTASGQRSMRDYVNSRPPELEGEAVFRALTLAAIARCPVYIVHVSTALGLSFVEQFRNDGSIPVYAETCPHYLLMTADDQATLGSAAKVSPPMRQNTDVEALWDGVARGIVDVISSDASGQCANKKAVTDGNAFAAPFGIPGVTEMVAVTLDEGRRRGIPLSRLIECFSAGPADIFGVASKGRLTLGSDADIVIYDEQQQWVVPSQPRLGGTTDYSLYEGRPITGRPIRSFTRGLPLLLADGTLSAAVIPSAAHLSK